MDSLLFFINGKKYEVFKPEPEMTVLEYIRSIGLTGSKLGCGEGGCGACTVMLSHYDRDTDQVFHRAVNACLAPICSISGMSVTTIEGLGNTKSGLNPVQERIATSNGSQCGFCTPGIVMQLYAFLRMNPNATKKQIEESFDGNLCRCTGYRPILDAAKTFGKEIGCGKKNCCQTQNKQDQNQDLNPNLKKWEYSPLNLESEPIFPPFLKNYEPKDLKFVGKKITWYRPINYDNFLEIKEKHPEAKIVTGNTEIGIENRFKNLYYPIIISPTEIKELNQIKLHKDGIEIGASVTLNNIRFYFENFIENKKEDKYQCRVLKAILDQLQWFAGNQIRNVASVGGNIVTASPISDLNPVWLGINATLTISSKKNGVRKLGVLDFFESYRKVNLNPNEVLVSIFVKFTKKNQYIKAFKQARRRDDDIAITSACFFVELDQNSKVVLFGTGYGGMAVKTITTPSTNEKLLSQTWNESLLALALECLEKDLPLSENAPGGMINFRKTLTTSFFFKFYLYVMSKISPESFDKRNTSALKMIERDISEGIQHFGSKREEEMKPIGENLNHVSAFKQVSGEAIYTDDMPNPVNGLYSALVQSTKAHAKVLNIDPLKALESPGVVAFFSAKDIPGINQVGPVILDEELFATDEVHCIGFPIGIIVADTHLNAMIASKLVEVTYEELPHVITIQEAIRQNSFHDEKHSIIDGNTTEAFENDCDHIIEGDVTLGGQEHFYLETNVSFVVPTEEEFVCYCSTQNPSKTQLLISKVLGISANKVTTKMKRMGGGFGGKETRSCFISAATAVAAYHLNQPVRCALDRDVDMSITGTRHPFYARYKVGVTKEGIINALQIDLYNNAGYSLDLSGAVMDRALFHVENCYKIKNITANGHLCKTNTPSNTAFRGFGGPQSMFITETWLEHVSNEINIDINELREKNFYKTNDKTHYLQNIDDSKIQEIWNQLINNIDLQKRKQEIDIFNETSRYKKRGLALVPTKFGMSFTVKFMNQAGALVHIYQDATVLVSHGGTEMGQGLHTKILQIAAHALKIPIDQIHISDTSTDKVPNTSPTAASVQSDMNGMAVLNACEILNERLAPFKEKNPKATFQELVNAAYFDRVSLSSTGFYKTPDVGYDFNGSGGRPFNYFNYGASCSEVEIDTLTGDHQILKTDILMDVGSSINPAIDIGQIEGAFVQGCGLWTLEELVTFDNGFQFTKGPSTYKIPGFGDIPVQFNVSLLENSENKRAIHSSKGIGEPPLFLSASVFFAIKDAIYSARKENNIEGYFNLISPATCERIRMSCSDNFTQQFLKK